MFGSGSTPSPLSLLILTKDWPALGAFQKMCFQLDRFAVCWFSAGLVARQLLLGLGCVAFVFRWLFEMAFL